MIISINIISILESLLYFMILCGITFILMKLLSTKKFLIILTIVSVPILFILNNFNFFNENSGGIQALSTVLLVAVTIFYAFYTAEMCRHTEKQIISNIKIDVLKASLKKFPNNVLKIEKEENIELDLSLNVYNKNSANGAITVPEIIIKSNNKDILRLSGSIHYDRGNGGIFLQGGEFKKINIFYRYIFGQNDDYLEKISAFEKSEGEIDFYLSYKDNLGDTHDDMPLKELKLRKGKNA